MQDSSSLCRIAFICYGLCYSTCLFKQAAAFMIVSAVWREGTDTAEVSQGHKCSRHPRYAGQNRKGWTVSVHIMCVCVCVCVRDGHYPRGECYYIVSTQHSYLSTCRGQEALRKPMEAGQDAHVGRCHTHMHNCRCTH